MTPPLLESAIRTVEDGTRAARSVQADIEQVRQFTKDDRSPVTVADFAVQAIVAMALLERDPDVLIVGEEHAAELREPAQAAILDAVVDSVRSVRPDATPSEILDAIDHCDHDGSAEAYWTLDPIDGTKGFLRGQQYAIALARIEGGRVTTGVMGCPNLPADPARPIDRADAAGVVYAAVLGGGSWDAGLGDRERITAAVPELHAIRTCESVEAAHSKQSDTVRILETMGSAGVPVRLDSQCKYAVVARGQADAYLRLPTRKGYVEKIWDHAAGSLIATEAGAVVTDIHGRPLDFTHGRRLETNRGIVCAAAGLHERIIAVIAELGIDAAA